MAQKIKYKWNVFGIAGVKAQDAGETLEKLRIKNNGALTPDIVVEEARPNDSPIHNCFEWDDSVAAERYRKEQAKHLIRCVVTIIENNGDKPQTIRAFTSVENGDGGRFYTTTAHALSDSELKKQVLRDLVRDIETLRKKYETYKFADIHGVFKLIDREVSRIAASTANKKKPTRKTTKQDRHSKQKIKRRVVKAA